eukprot:CAMPEP_0194360982 /NCGR_PEP_ID=MMETSP0174-20130528/8461_1 /TAXON_ID=216777 /ORGANISM="Proboscia alata, Strain PI-D3" /LENGTH=168 /DNA_ID=CAMNT_0039132849 /DNA_START=111 /DNA_END=613 /DNA_ORIENTATION=+
MDAFPRGSGQDDKPQSSSEPKRQNRDDDVLFGSKPSNTQKPKRTRTSDPTTSTATTNPLLALGGGHVYPPTQHSTLPVIEPLSFAKLLPQSTRLLGILRTLHPDYALVSLPHLLTGYIRRPKDLKGLGAKSIGRVLSCVVIHTASDLEKGGIAKRRMELSIHPNDVNS